MSSYSSYSSIKHRSLFVLVTRTKNPTKNHSPAVFPVSQFPYQRAQPIRRLTPRKSQVQKLEAKFWRSPGSPMSIISEDSSLCTVDSDQKPNKKLLLRFFQFNHFHTKEDSFKKWKSSTENGPVYRCRLFLEFFDQPTSLYTGGRIKNPTKNNSPAVFLLHNFHTREDNP